MSNVSGMTQKCCIDSTAHPAGDDVQLVVMSLCRLPVCRTLT